MQKPPCTASADLRIPIHPCHAKLVVGKGGLSPPLLRLCRSLPARPVLISEFRFTMSCKASGREGWFTPAFPQPADPSFLVWFSISLFHCFAATANFLTSSGHHQSRSTSIGPSLSRR